MSEENDTLCISCRNACKSESRCPWAGALIPVDGWEAEETKNGYRVISCPLFSPGRGLPHEIDTHGMMRLLEAAAQQARNDYLLGIDIYSESEKKAAVKDTLESRVERRVKNRKSIEYWILHNGSALLGISNPEEVVRMLRKMARRHDEEIMKLLTR